MGNIQNNSIIKSLKEKGNEVHKGQNEKLNYLFEIKLKQFYDLLDELRKSTKGVQNETQYDNIQIANIKLLCINIFLLMEDITITSDLEIPNKNQLISNEVKTATKNLLNTLDLSDTANLTNRRIDDIIDNMTPQVINNLVSFQNEKQQKKNNLDEATKKLQAMNQEVTNKANQIADNFYFLCYKKMKQAFEVVHLYFNQIENINKTHVTNFIGKEKFDADQNARESLIKINQNKNQPDIVHNVANYVLMKNQENKNF